MGGGTTGTGRASSAFKIPIDGKGKSRHHPGHLFALAFRAGHLFGGIENQFLEFVFALITVILVNRHLQVLL